MSLIGGTMVAIQLARLVHDFAKDPPKGYVIMTKDKGRLRTRFRITCSNRRPDESNRSSDKKHDNAGMEVVLSVQAKNPQLFAQKLLQRYTKRSNVDEWFNLSKQQLQDLEEIVVLIYAANG